LQCADVKFTSSALVRSSLPSKYLSQCIKYDSHAPTATRFFTGNQVKHEQHDLSAGAIFSIVFSLVVASIFIAIGFLVLKRRKAKQQMRAFDQGCISEGEDVPSDERLPSYNEAVHNNDSRK
jgi:hypothetical protein